MMEDTNRMKNQHYVVYGIMALGIYLVATGVSLFAFRSIPTITSSIMPKKSVDTTIKKPLKPFMVDPTLPKTELCPINGSMHTKKEQETWITRRPLAVMIENHEESRPQSGLSMADVIYETVAEGGVTRFMGIYYCSAGAGNIPLAPVRSARTYFLPWVLEYDALYNHVGGAGNCDDDTVDERAKALCQIDQYKIKDLDQFGLPFKSIDENGKKYSVCYRNPDRLDHPVAYEHTMVCETDGLNLYAKLEREWTNVDTKGIAWDKKFESWKFKDDAAVEARGTVKTISFAPWKGYEAAYGVSWAYDATKNAYLRSNGGKPHMDLETEEQLSAKAIIVQFAKETGPVDDHMHLLYANIGSGNGLLFQDGTSQKITWQKADRSARTKFFDDKGKEVLLTRGQLWIEMLPIGSTVTY